MEIFTFTLIWIKNGRYSVFQSPNGDGKLQFLIENATVKVFIQKFDYGITVIFEKINGNTVVQNLVFPPPNGIKSSTNKIVTYIGMFHAVYFQTVCSTFVGVALLHNFHSSVSWTSRRREACSFPKRSWNKIIIYISKSVFPNTY